MNVDSAFALTPGGLASLGFLFIAERGHLGRKARLVERPDGPIVGFDADTAPDATSSTEEAHKHPVPDNLKMFRLHRPRLKRFWLHPGPELINSTKGGGGCCHHLDIGVDKLDGSVEITATEGFVSPPQFGDELLFLRHHPRSIAPCRPRGGIPDVGRENAVRVTLTDSELARLDELRPAGTTRPAFIRSLLREPPTGQEVATRTEALAILTALAGDGRVAAAIALERATREKGLWTTPSTTSSVVLGDGPTPTGRRL